MTRLSIFMLKTPIFAAMPKGLHIVVLLLAIICPLFSAAQTDTSKHGINERLKRIEHELKSNPALKKEYEDLTFYYSQMFRNMADSQQNKGIQISGYADAYYAYYTDEAASGTYQKFPTVAPYSNAFSLNMLMLSARYQDDRVRGVVALHYGDIPASAWSPVYNAIQEANAGVRLVKKLWLDAGFFRTHLGFESIQPRENIGSSLALTTYYEPYYLSGAKLTWYPTPRLTLQLNAFNGFNTFVAVNKKKAFGFSAVYEFTPQLVLTFNTLLSDNSADTLPYSQQRLYNNAYAAYKSKHWDIGAELNYGMQKHTGLADSTATATMYSMLLAAKYKIYKGRYAVYTRGELFNDKDEILTGPVYNSHHQLVGIKSYGITGGLEFKPAPNSFLRLESRVLHLDREEALFKWKGRESNRRMEYIASLGVWF